MKLEYPRFDSARLLVVGDLMLDRYWYGGTSRISPKSPVPVVKVNSTEDRIGVAGNVALNIASLGAAAAIVAVVGRDEAAAVLTSRLASAGITSDFQVSATRPTITKLRVVSRSQQLLRMDFEEPFSADDTSELLAKTREYLPGVGALVLSDYAKGALADPQPLIQAARRQGIPVLVDPKGSAFARYLGATLLTPNLHEFEAVVGECASEHELADRGL